MCVCVCVYACAYTRARVCLKMKGQPEGIRFFLPSRGMSMSTTSLLAILPVPQFIYLFMRRTKFREIKSLNLHKQEKEAFK